MNFVELVNAYGRTVPKGAPPIMVAHPNYGELGTVEARKGFIPKRGRWASARAILRDANRNTIKLLRGIEDHAPKFVTAAIIAAIAKNPMALPYIIGTISTYDGIVAARGGNVYQDYWMALTATFTPVTLSWYDTWKMAWTPGTVPTVTAYTNAGTGGAVLDATSNGSWIANPAGSNHRYIVSCGLSTTSITGVAIAMLMDNLWAGSYAITSNATINPTTDVPVTRYATTTSPGNMMMVVLTSTLTHTGAPVLTTTYTDQAGVTGKTTAGTAPATGVLVNRVIYNTGHGVATVVASTPFMPLTNAGSSGVRSLEQVVVSGGTCTVGTVDHKIVRPLIVMPFIAAASYIEQDSTLNIGNMVELVNVSQVCGCISWAVFSAGTTALTFSSFLRTVEG